MLEVVFGRLCVPNQTYCLLGSPELGMIEILFYLIAHSIVTVNIADELILFMSETPGIVCVCQMQAWVEPFRGGHINYRRSW